MTIKENDNRCVCVGCPSYSQCSREKQEKLFCCNGVSGCAMSESKVCICEACPIHQEEKIIGKYFCLGNGE